MESKDPIFSDLEEGIYREPASLGTRFGNYLIDLVAFYVVVFIISFLAGYLKAISTTSLPENSTLTGSLLGDFLFSYGVYALYYLVWEGFSKGKSMGKLITGSVAIREDGSPITWNDALMRSLIRLIPIEPFSAFGQRPWHDAWTNTEVIKKQR